MGWGFYITWYDYFLITYFLFKIFKTHARGLKNAMSPPCNRELAGKPLSVPGTKLCCPWVKAMVSRVSSSYRCNDSVVF